VLGDVICTRFVLGPVLGTGHDLFGPSLRQVDRDVGLVASVSAGPGSDLSEESVVGVEPAALGIGVAPGCPPGPVAVSGWASRTRRR
jgi:hypothetical protein